MANVITLSPVELLLRVSKATVGAGEVPAGSNAGPYVRRVLKRTGNKEGDPWCASQISDWGAIALEELWPIPLTASVMVMCDWAAKTKCRYQATKVTPKVGDLLAIWYPSMKRWAHICLIVEVHDDGTVTTRDGNTSGDGGREGWLVAEKRRKLATRDRLIRWVDVLK